MEVLGTQIGDMTVYTCDNGYQLYNGGSVRSVECGADAQWAGTPSQCFGKLDNKDVTTL